MVNGLVNQISSYFKANYCTMKSSSMTPTTTDHEKTSFRSPSISSVQSTLFDHLDTAVEYLMVYKDFQLAFDTCEKANESLHKIENDSNCRYCELKDSLCIVGIQALAELNQWRRVLGWVLQQYGSAEKIPAKITVMCILLYSKVGEPATMDNVSHDWLLFPDNKSFPGYRTVAECYLLHVLLPLGRIEEARQLLSSNIGQTAFTADQRLVALDLIESHNKPQETDLPVATSEVPPQMVPKKASSRGSVVQRLVFRLISIAQSRWKNISLRHMFLGIFLLYLLLVKMDPALPSSFPWVLKLLQLLKQMWNAMFGPYYKANVAT